MNAVAEVARIKSELAVREAAWCAAILARLEQGNATTRELRDVIGAPGRASVTNLLGRMRKLGLIKVASQLPGQRGRQLNIWTIGEGTQ